NRAGTRLSLVSAVAQRPLLSQYPVHRPPRAMVLPAAQQRRVDLTGRLVDEFLGVHHGEQLRPLRLAQPPVRARLSLVRICDLRRLRLDGSVVGGPLEPHGIARAIHRDLLLALLDEFDSGISSFSSILGSASPRISCAFPDSSRSLRWMRFSFSIAASLRSSCSTRRSSAVRDGLRPGRPGASPSRPCSALCLRQVPSCEL